MRANVLKIWPGFLFLVLFLSALQFWPASWWLEVASIRVDNGSDSSKLEMYIDRKINHSFIGQWDIVIRRWEGEWVFACSATGGGGNFIADSKAPKHLTLGSWTDKQCHPLEPGRYMISKTWKIQLLGLMPDKFVTQTSNAFVVTTNDK